ncbi:MAG: phosphatidate cytidylyltransferase [Candidatus Omnitrophica bacterium]|nr:phosphatidate cytidylyltransferase [Candidatus Omnitrophota bacterium]
MFLKRIISSILLVGVIVSAIFIEWMFYVTVMCFIIAGLYEFFGMLKQKGIRSFKYVGIGLGAIIPLSIIFRFEPTKNWELFFIVSMLLFLFLMQFRRQGTTGVIVDISTTIFGIIYISWFFSFLIKIRAMDIGYLSAILLITKLGDIGAYVVGMRCGKTPFVPLISPKKSIEGSIGGFLFSIGGALLCKPFLHFTYFHLMVMGIFFGIMAQLGDLFESMIKRDCLIKDAGKLFPGLGGVLDTIDSVLFTAPAFYFYLSVIKN